MGFKMFFPRLITIVIGIPLVAFCIYWGAIPYFLFIVCLVLFALDEFIKIVKKGGYLISKTTSQISGVLLVLSIYFNKTQMLSNDTNQGTAIVLTFMLLLLFIIEFFKAEIEYALLRAGVTVLSVLYIVWTLGHLLLIRDIRPYGMEFTYYIFILIWTIDISAYIIGVSIGKHKLFPKISPNKTVEGFIGAIVFGILGSLVITLICLRTEFSIIESMVLGGVMAVFAQLSDLIESLIKRSVGVKDSSTLLPGHGGVLDRFDSFIFTAPLFFYYLSVFH